VCCIADARYLRVTGCRPCQGGKSRRQGSAPSCSLSLAMLTSRSASVHRSLSRWASFSSRLATCTTQSLPSADGTGDSPHSAPCSQHTSRECVLPTEFGICTLTGAGHLHASLMAYVQQTRHCGCCNAVHTHFSLTCNTQRLPTTTAAAHTHGLSHRHAFFQPLHGCITCTAPCSGDTAGPTCAASCFSRSGTLRSACALDAVAASLAASASLRRACPSTLMSMQRLLGMSGAGGCMTGSRIT